MIGFVACAPTISKQKVIENGECGRWRPVNRISVILRPNTNQCVAPIAWGKVELNSRRFRGHLVGAKAHDLGNELLIDDGYDVAAADALWRLIKREVMPVRGPVVFADVTKPHRSEGRHSALRKRGAVSVSKECVVVVAAFGGIPHEGHLHHPQRDQLLLIDVQADTLAFKHRLKNGLKCRLKLAHPASVTVVTDSLCCQFAVKDKIGCARALKTEGPEILPLENPLRPDMLTASSAVAAENALVGHVPNIGYRERS